MPRYLVFMPNGHEKVTSTFPKNHVIQEDTLWAIHTDEATCLDVCRKLEMLDQDEGVVFAIDEYYGRFDVGLWQRLADWAQRS